MRIANPPECEAFMLDAKSLLVCRYSGQELLAVSILNLRTGRILNQGNHVDYWAFVAVHEAVRDLYYWFCSAKWDEPPPSWAQAIVYPDKEQAP